MQKLNLYNSLFMVCILDLEQFRWSFGRAWTRLKLLNKIIKLPVKKIKINENLNEYIWKIMLKNFFSEPHLIDLFKQFYKTKKLFYLLLIDIN